MGAILNLNERMARRDAYRLLWGRWWMSTEPNDNQTIEVYPHRLLGVMQKTGKSIRGHHRNIIFQVPSGLEISSELIALLLL